MKAPAETVKPTGKIEQQENEILQDHYTITHFDIDQNKPDIGVTLDASKMELNFEKELKEVVAEEAPKPETQEPFKRQYRKHNHEVQLDYTLLKSEVRNGQTPLIAVHGWMDNKASF